MKKILIVFLAAALIIGVSSQGFALTHLGFMVDSSGSIGDSNFSDMKAGIAAAFTNVFTSDKLDGSFQISLVRFARYADTIIEPLVLDSEGDLVAAVDAITGMSYLGGTTCMSCGLTTLTSNFTGDSLYSADNYAAYNIATDGVPNDDDETVTARDAAISAGINEIDAEFIGQVDSDGYNFLKNKLVYPEPADTTGFTPGFIVGVSFENFEAAFTNKLKSITEPPNGVPEPSTLLLVGIGLLGLAGCGRKKFN